MSEKSFDFLKKFEVLKRLKKEFFNQIKLLFVFKQYVFCDKQYYDNVLIVTNDDKVFAFGNNSCGVLGFGNDNKLNELTINEELSNKQIIDFKNSSYHVIARTIDGKVYCWGFNWKGVLGNGKSDNNTYKPVLNEYLRTENIIDICCGFEHTLAITTSGQVYAWGRNDWGQIGNQSYKNQLTPIRVIGFQTEKVIMISCGLSQSMALTESGHVFCWGRNDGQLSNSNNYKLNKPSIVILSNEISFKKISCGSDHNLLMSSDGDVYWFGNNGCETRKTPHKLTINSNKFIDITSHFKYGISIAVTTNGFYYIWGEFGEEKLKEPKETEFKSFDDIFAEYFQITYGTLRIDMK
jgi:hypothetical protein